MGMFWTIAAAGMLSPAQEAPRLRMEGCVWSMVFFEPDSAEIVEDAAQILRSFLGGAPRYIRPSSYYIVDGHADQTGSRSYNLALSRRRAEAVRRFLVDAGFPAHRLVVRPNGVDQPLSDTMLEPNRRVTLIQLDPVLDKPPPPGAVLC